MANIDEINELVGNKNFEEAEKLIKTALEEEVDNPELVKLAGLVDVNLQNWDSAKVHFETIVKLFPDEVSAIFCTHQPPLRTVQTSSKTFRAKP